MGFVYFDHTGDIGLTVTASSLDELFSNAAHGLTDTITDRHLVEASESVAVDLRASAVDLLFVDWINELVYRFEAEGFLVAQARVTVARRSDHVAVTGLLEGERFEPGRHPIKTLVKAATYHALQVRHVGSEWHARVVLDV